EGLARPKDVAEPARGDLEDGVGEGERREEQAELLIAESELTLDVRRHGAEADAVEVGDHRQRAGEAEHTEANTRRACAGGGRERGWHEGAASAGGRRAGDGLTVSG